MSYRFITAMFLSLSIPVTFAAPHFYVVMENRSSKEATIRFEAVKGNVSLIPTMDPNTTLPPLENSIEYGVQFEPLGRDDVFNIIFKGKQDCAFTVAFFGINNPKITISGDGCYGGGYRIQGKRVYLSIYDIHYKR